VWWGDVNTDLRQLLLSLIDIKIAETAIVNFKISFSDTHNSKTFCED
jgi:hypothetical protein